jgi:hypothetical protein
VQERDEEADDRENWCLQMMMIEAKAKMVLEKGLASAGAASKEWTMLDLNAY